jgi:hypothetical protein
VSCHSYFSIPFHSIPFHSIPFHSILCSALPLPQTPPVMERNHLDYNHSMGLYRYHQELAVSVNVSLFCARSRTVRRVDQRVVWCVSRRRRQGVSRTWLRKVNFAELQEYERASEAIRQFAAAITGVAEEGEPGAWRGFVRRGASTGKLEWRFQRRGNWLPHVESHSDLVNMVLWMKRAGRGEDDSLFSRAAGKTGKRPRGGGTSTGSASGSQGPAVIARRLVWKDPRFVSVRLAGGRNKVVDDAAATATATATVPPPPPPPAAGGMTVHGGGRGGGGGGGGGGVQEGVAEDAGGEVRRMRVLLEEWKESTRPWQTGRLARRSECVCWKRSTAWDCKRRRSGAKRP